MNTARDIWWAEYEVRAINERNGKPWPRVCVEKWERNRLGERRYVESRFYELGPPAVPTIETFPYRASVLDE